ncbi:MAG: hypothetical protein ACJ71R_18635 [Nitrososphaeraceae archaeon]
MAWWNAEEYQIQTLAGMLMVSWDKETRKNTIDALASYRAKALPALAYFASIVWDKELKEYALIKIKQINEGTV